MEISVLATKCRFCGEAVGRPRDETRSLSIDDLGGETIRHYAPSSSVMEAMEAFRSEHDFKSNPPEDTVPERKSLFGMSGKKKGGSVPSSASGDMPQLDERSQALASLAMPASKPATFRKPQGPSMTARAIQFVGIALGIVLLLFLANVAYKHYNKPAVEPSRHKPNPAEAILARGGDPTQAVIEAAKSLKAEPHSKNEAVLETAHQKFEEKIDGLLNASPWTQESLRDANREVSAVFKVDSSPEILQLQEEVDAETFAYQMSVLSIADDNSEATFGLSQAASGEQAVKVKPGDTINGRFKVISIKRDHVQLEDTKRKNRLLTYSVTDSRITSP